MAFAKNSPAHRSSAKGLTGRMMSGPPKISVATPTFNGIATIRETIESVRTQEYKNWEHIVIDGRSIDGTVELLGTYAHLQWVLEKDTGVKCTT